MATHLALEIQVDETAVRIEGGEMGKESNARNKVLV